MRSRLRSGMSILTATFKSQAFGFYRKRAAKSSPRKLA